MLSWKKYGLLFALLFFARDLSAQQDKLLGQAAYLYRQGAYSLALQTLDKAVTANPEWAEAFNLRGLTLKAMGNLNMAIQDFTKAIGLFPRYIDAYNNRGMCYIQQQEYEKANTDFGSCLELSRGSRDIYYFNRANSELAGGKPQDAINDYTAAVKVNPEMAEAFNNRGRARLNMKDTAGALADYQKAIDALPSFLTGYVNLALLQEARGDCKAALDVYRKYLRWDEADARVYLQIGALQEECFGNREEALKSYDKAIRLQPQLADAYNNRGTLEMHQQDYKKALRDFDRALTYDSQSPAFYFNRGMALKAMGKKENAIKDFTSAIEIDSTYQAAIYNRAHLEMETGHKPEACADLQTALRLGVPQAADELKRGCN